MQHCPQDFFFGGCEWPPAYRVWMVAMRAGVEATGVWEIFKDFEICENICKFFRKFLKFSNFYQNIWNFKNNNLDRNASDPGEIFKEGKEKLQMFKILIFIMGIYMEIF